MPDLNPVMLQSPLIREGSPSAKPNITPNEAQRTFANQLKDAINKVNEYQVQSNQMTQALARGEVRDLHNVMITAQKASVTMKATIEIQSKVIDAYKEIMRMQV